MIIVSPWTRGGWVNSQLLDHTSLIRFLEARFAHRRPDLVESNITPWRRAVVGDLTTAFDFKTPNTSNALFSIDFRNSGRAAAVFQVRSAVSAQEPRSYTVEPGKHLTDTWDVVSGCDLADHGPNGFFRGFKGGHPGGHRANLDVTASYDERHNDIVLEIRNRSSERAAVTVRSGYASRGANLSLMPGQAEREQWPLSRTRGWYDLVITVEGDPQFEYRYAGHLENGEDSISDPAMGGLV